MKHYIITMFNLRLTWGGVDYSKDKNYLKNRFQLFEQYTLPSIRNQSNSNFDWIVLFSNSTPGVFREKISRYQKEIANFIPLFIEDSQALEFRSILVSYIKKDTTDYCVVTTRCDNDDILSTHFVEEIQNNVKYNEEYVLSFPNGYQYDEKTLALRKYYFPTSHFTTFVSNNKDRTIYDFLHMDIMDNCKVELVDTAPLWIEVIHGENVYNCMGSIHFSDYIREYDLKEGFSVPLVAKHSMLHTLFLYIYFAMHKFWVKRGRIMAVLKRKLRR